MKMLSNLLELEIDALPEVHHQRLHGLRIAFEDEEFRELPNGPARQALELAVSEIGGIVLVRLAPYLDGIDLA